MKSACGAPVCSIQNGSKILNGLGVHGSQLLLVLGRHLLHAGCYPRCIDAVKNVPQHALYQGM